MENAIGFAGTFYTLWEVESCEYYTRYAYVKNISTDKNKALSLYPNADFDSCLRGKTRSWVRVTNNSNENNNTSVIAKREIMQKMDSFAKTLTQIGIVEVVADANLTVGGELAAFLSVKVGDYYAQFNFDYNDCKFMYYNGCAYALPVINGVAKKIKQKKFIIEFVELGVALNYKVTNIILTTN